MEDQDLSLVYMIQKPVLPYLVRFWRLENSKSWTTNKKATNSNAQGLDQIRTGIIETSSGTVSQT